MRIIHANTIVQTTFLVVDDEDNAVGQPVTIQQSIFSLTPDEFTAAYRQIVARKPEILKEFEDANTADNN